MKDYWAITYTTYLILAIPAMIWVASTLRKNGQLFLIDVFDGDEVLAKAVNHLLVVGFYLVNMGFIALFMRVQDKLATGREAMEMTFWKLGTVFLVLGAMHFFNIIIFTKLRRAKLNGVGQVPPPAPRKAFHDARATYPDC